VKYVIVLLAVSAFALTCISPNQCDLAEQYNLSRSVTTLDRGHEKYEFRLDFIQNAKIYVGDCADNKNVNETKLKLTSFAPCEQEVTFNVEMQFDTTFTYEYGEQKVIIQPNETLDFGTIFEGQMRIQYADIRVELYCPLCPDDQ